jgi:hypothetical protein
VSPAAARPGRTACPCPASSQRRSQRAATQVAGGVHEP